MLRIDAFFRQTRANLQQGLAFWGGELRSLTSQEIRILESQNNLCENWGQLQVSTDFTPLRIAGNRFEGRVVLGRLETPCGLFRSTLIEAEVGPGTTIDQNSFLRRCWIEGPSTVLNSRVDCTQASSFGLGRKILVGPETGGRWIPTSDDLSLESAQVKVNSPQALQAAEDLAQSIKSPFSYVGPNCFLVNLGQADGVFLAGNVEVRGCAQIENSFVTAEPENPACLGAGVCLRSCLVQAGVHLDTFALAENSVFLEFSGGSDHVRLSESMIGPNTHLSSGEVHSCFLGPFVGMHHQSLLISCWWPQGRGNLGYGANVGSNHTSRAPDQEIRPGEGMFFGLDCAVKFPADFSESPYSLVATGVVTESQRMELPFSLLLEGSGNQQPAPGLTRVIPGWVLAENFYMVWRNETKFQKRNRLSTSSWDLRVLRPEIVDKLWKAREALAERAGKEVYTQQDICVIGRNYLLESDRKKAVLTYHNFTLYSALRFFAEKTYRIRDYDPAWLQGLFQRLGLDFSDRIGLLKAFLAHETALWESARASKQKDDRRGAQIFDDWEQFWPRGAEDEVLLAKEKELQEWKVRILGN
ncbi:MAG: DUF4954 family protein [Spirochaetales bacterium]|nr:DUF4954 family protein [Spirochaetales bacterium]